MKNMFLFLDLTSAILVLIWLIFLRRIKPYNFRFC